MTQPTPPALPPPAERRALRKAFGYFQEEAADELGITRETFSRWETGKSEPSGPKGRAYMALVERWRQSLHGRQETA